MKMPKEEEDEGGTEHRREGLRGKEVGRRRMHERIIFLLGLLYRNLTFLLRHSKGEGCAGEEGKEREDSVESYRDKEVLCFGCSCGCWLWCRARGKGVSCISGYAIIACVGSDSRRNSLVGHTTRQLYCHSNNPKEMTSLNYYGF